MRWFLALGLALGLPAALPAADDGVEAAIRRLDSAYVQAYLASDVARFRELLADDFSCILADGRVLDRARFLEMAGQPAPVAGFRTDQIGVRVYGDAAVANGRATYRRADGGTTATRYVEVYVRRGGLWRMVSAQFTRLP